MKNVILASCLAFVSVACGSQANDSQTAGFPGFRPVLTPEQQPVERNIHPVLGSIVSVKAEAASNGASGLWTTVTVGFPVPCYEKLESVSVTTGARKDGKIEVLASAFASAAPRKEGEFVCQSFRQHEETVTVAGIVSAQDLLLVNMFTDNSKKVPADTVSINPIQKIEVIETEPSCPKGAFCITNGTRVTLALTLNSCVNTLGPIAYRGIQTDVEAAKATLTIKALEFVSKNAMNVRCIAPQIVTTSVSLPMIFAGKDTLELNILK